MFLGIILTGICFTDFVALKSDFSALSLISRNCRGDGVTERVVPSLHNPKVMDYLRTLLYQLRLR